MSDPPSISRRWCFTLNNYLDEDVVALRATLSLPKIRYAVFGFEVCPETKTPHLQGYFSSRTAIRFNAAKAMVSTRAHLEAAKGSEEVNFAYCSKGSKFEEFGRRSSSGTRSDLTAFMDAVKAGETDLKNLREKFPAVVAKYPRFVKDYIDDHTPLPDIPCHPLRDWQQELSLRLNRPPEERCIIFIVDPTGNNGKTWFAKYYCRLHDQAVVLRPTKHADMAYCLPQKLRVLFLDCTRQQVEHLPYSFLEQVKDGLVFSNKYESRVKHYPPVHVVVLLNKDPDMDALSADRYSLVNL